MTELLQDRLGTAILEVGTGKYYQTAILAKQTPESSPSNGLTHLPNAPGHAGRGLP